MIYKHNSKLTPSAKHLRKTMTKEERTLWFQFLRSYPVRFLRQKVIDNYVVDFYCAKAKLVVELDGSQHYSDSGIQHDKIRTECIEQHGLTVIRIPNNAVNENFSGVCQYIEKAVADALRNPLP